MRKSQQGASYIGILFGVVLFAIAAKAVLAIWPAYWDDRIIDNQINELLAVSPQDISNSEFSSKMQQRFEMNNLRDLQFKDIAALSYEGGKGLVVDKKYEVRKKFLMNIDLVLTFEKRFDQRSAEVK